MRKYVGRYMCPNTKKYLSPNDVDYSHGICPHCGDDNKNIFTHNIIEVGYWRKVTWWGKHVWVKK